jgi:hypothetical protein
MANKSSKHHPDIELSPKTVQRYAKVIHNRPDETANPAKETPNQPNHAKRTGNRRPADKRIPKS